MSTQNDYVRSFTAAEAVSAYTRAGITTSGQVYTAPANNTDVGIFQEDAASGDQVPVRLYKNTFLMMAAGAITAGSQVYPAASGLISGSSTGTAIGSAYDAASNAREVIEIISFI